MKKLSLLMILSVLILLSATGCKKQVFSGSSTGNDTPSKSQFSCNVMQV